MITRFVEATQSAAGGFVNHGKFMVAKFDQEEWQRRTEVDFLYDGSVKPLVSRCGWSPNHVLVFDLQTGEGALFSLGGMPRADLEKHRVWVCPMFEPFLVWLYGWRKSLEELPPVVELPDAEFSMAGYRRPGPSEGGGD